MQSSGGLAAQEEVDHRERSSRVERLGWTCWVCVGTGSAGILQLNLQGNAALGGFFVDRERRCPLLESGLIDISSGWRLTG